MNAKKIDDEFSNVHMMEDYRGDYLDTIILDFDRSMIDKHGLVKGVYNVYFSKIASQENECVDPACEEIMVRIKLRMVAAIDTDGEMYRTVSLAPENILAKLIATNRDAIVCMTHKYVRVEDTNNSPELKGSTEAEVIDLLERIKPNK